MHYAWVITIIGALVILLSHGFGRMSYSVILPFMREGLGLTYTQAGLIGTGNFLGYLALATFGGLLASRFGGRLVIFVSLLVMGVSLFLTGLSKTFSFAFIMRMVTGAGNGGSFVPMMALPAIWFAARKRGLAIGIVNMGVGAGLSLSGLLLPYCIGCHGPDGWRYAWYLMGIVVFACAFLCYFFLRDNPGEKGLAMYGGTDGPPGTPVKTTLFSALRLVIKETEIWKLGCVYFMFGFSYIIYLTFFVAYLTREMGMPTGEAGGIFALIGFLGICCGVLWGAVSDLLGRRCASMCIYLTLASSCLLFAFSRECVGFYGSAVLFGVGGFAIPVIMAAAVGDAVGGRLAPAGLGFITIFFGSGQALGPFVGGWIKDRSGTFTYAFAVAALVCLLGALCSLSLRPKPKLQRGRACMEGECP